jgi:hypothetical protein
VTKRHKIGLAVFGDHPTIDITAEEAAAIRAAKRDLIVFIGIEGKFDLLVANYVEYETTVLDLAVNQMVYRDWGWHEGQDEVQLVNRRLLNVLAAARLYLDQVRHDFGQVYPADGKEMVKKLTAEQYDGKLGYRVMEELRNSVQHRTLPVDGITYSTTVDAPGRAGTGVRFGVIPGLDPARLAAGDRDFKPRILGELREKSEANKGKRVPLTPLLREYVEGLGAVNEALRKHAETDVERCGKLLASVIEQARREISEQTLGLAVVVEDEEGNWSDEDDIFGDLWTRWQGLVTKNRLHERLARRYVNGRGEGD